MPKLDGIDVQSALSRIGGNQKLYRKLLVQFHRNHKNDIKTIRQTLDLGDLETAERMIHTIKGAAGNIEKSGGDKGTGVFFVPRAARINSKRGIYHIIMREINRQTLFEDEEDCWNSN